MRRLCNFGRAVLCLELAALASGCGGDTCTRGCPTTGQAAAEGDLRLVLDSDNSSVFIEDEVSSTDGAVMSGELVIRPESPGCVASPEHPCAATLLRLTVTITDLQVGDFSVREPTVSIDAPMEVLDIGNGIAILEGSNVHTCATVEGARHHAVEKARVAANIMLDDGTSPLTALQGASASLVAWWPLVLNFPVDGCTSQTLDLTMYASFARP